MNALRIEKAAYTAQQESMVQLVVVAPSVNVSLGADFANNVCTHDMKVVHEKVRFCDEGKHGVRKSSTPSRQGSTRDLKVVSTCIFEARLRVAGRSPFCQVEVIP